ncbi:Clavaminate synthase-like protein, partial [Pyrenochaeta sp. DS3sAY3a]
LRTRSASTQLFRRYYSTSLRFSKARQLQCDVELDIESFNANEPIVIPNVFSDLPAIKKWFVPSTTNPGALDLNASYLKPYDMSMVPLELTSASPETHQNSFDQFEAPLSLLIAHMTGPPTPDTRLYLAQHSLHDLPSDLQNDLPTPSLIFRIGRGDIYASSVWMGRPPTRTPLHRDPNPNLFVQLAGQKVVRLMRPEVGRAVYEKVRAEVGRAGGKANMRGQEMMEGTEMEALENAVWNEQGAMEEGVEATLERGDGL